MPVKTTPVELTPLHNTWSLTGFTVGVGLTVIVKLMGVPPHPLALGVTLIFAIVLTPPRLTALNDEISPLPLAARPMEGSLLVQL